MPKDFKAHREYNKWLSIEKLFTEKSTGLMTSRDSTTVCFSSAELERTVTDLIALDESTFRAKYAIGKDTRNWSYSRAKADVQPAYSKSKLRKIQYRTWDYRYTYYTGKVNGFHSWPVRAIMEHVLEESNLALIACRFQSSANFRHAFITRGLIDKCAISTQPKESNYLFPLYRLAPDTALESEARKLVPNFNPAELKKIEKALGEKVISQQLFDYIYAVLHSPTYRERYREFLKIDFPRIPYPTDKGKYTKLANLGHQLREVHLMKNAQSWALQTTFPKAGNATVEKVEWGDGRVYINSVQYFDNVPKAVWEFYIGGYQPAQKWLKDRKAKRGEAPRGLSFDGIQHYQRIVHALSETMRLMAEVDEVFGQD